MPKAYCQDCFLATEYSSSPAKFCAHCGQSLIGGVNVKPVKKQPAVEVEDPDVDEVDASDETDNTPLPNVKDLGIKIEYSKPKGEKLSSLAKGDGKQTRIQNDTSVKTKPLTRKQILAEFQKEAGAIRPKKSK